MTDLTANDSEAAERIRRLQERRAASSPAARVRPATATAAAGSSATGGPRKATPASRTRRPHPAAATRWLLGGLSIASFFGIGGAVAAANLNSAATAATSASATTAGAVASTAAAAPVTPATPRATNATSVATNAPVVAHSTTHGS
ncbi:MAG: hypothetical protein JJE46_12930 [Acidimicrobiia bacterium]|nr:hypothetical protein [Acidimicrobiia bacterium]